jgi:hypothetical protein
MVRPAMPGHPPKPHDITKYHRGPWHFVNFPLILPADTASFSAASFPIENTNILSALSNAVNTLHDPLAVPGDKAVSLCWVLHLVGDLHQPLHTVKLISNTYTNGDQGGNALTIAEPGHHPVKLHAFWDDLLGSGESYTFIEHLADGLDAGTQYDPAKSKNYKKHKTQASWAAESVAAAQAIAYLDGQLEFADWKAFEARHITAADVPVLTTTYILNATDAARQRVALAGRRLADTLKKAF